MGTMGPRLVVMAIIATGFWVGFAAFGRLTTNNAIISIFVAAVVMAVLFRARKEMP